MKIKSVQPTDNNVLIITMDDGTVGNLNISKWLNYEAFAELTDRALFSQVHNGGYFIEWSCGADLSIDSVLANWDRVV